MSSSVGPGCCSYWLVAAAAAAAAAAAPPPPLLLLSRTITSPTMTAAWFPTDCGPCGEEALPRRRDWWWDAALPEWF